MTEIKVELYACRNCGTPHSVFLKCWICEQPYCGICRVGHEEECLKEFTEEVRDRD